jgi:twinkle protein
MFDAARYIPAGIIGKEELWESLVNYNSMPAHPYPKCLDGVNKKLKGKRGGEITLFISGTGSGKSTIIREIGLDVLETTKDDKIGIISLEESPAETARKYAGMALNRNPDKEEIPIEELKPGFDKVFGSDRVILLDHQGSIDDNTIIDQLEYMCLSGCKYLFIDHITILVSEGTGDLKGNEAQDKVMNDLLRLVKRHPTVWVGLVSHLRKVQGGGKSFEEGKLPNLDDIRGSGSIKQISFDVIAFARNLNAQNEIERNTIKMAILKARRTGLTGRVNDVRYSYDTGRLTALEGMATEEFTSL